MPAQTMEGFVPQMKKKGRIQIGMDADIKHSTEIPLPMWVRMRILITRLLVYQQ